MNDLSQVLRTQRLRLTSSRKIIFDVLHASERALSPREVFQKVNKQQKSKTDLVSVYRNLAVFADLGLAHRLHDGRYALCKQEEHPGDHVHCLISCPACGKTQEIESHSRGLCQLIKKLKTAAGIVDLQSVTLHGRCSSCSD